MNPLERLEQILSDITPADETAMEETQRRWDAIAKPLNGLGLLEKLIVRAAGVLETPDVDLSSKAVVAFCADNGVVAEGVTQTGQEVTAAVASSMAFGRSCVCRMAQVAGAEVVPVDIGMAVAVSGPALITRPVRRGTANMVHGPAMTREEAALGILAGIDMARACVRRGVKLLATGEMGIGNTTTAAAVSSVLLDVPPRQVTGRGAGLSDQGLERKTSAIQRAIEVNAPDPRDALDVLSKVGGLDIAGMAGLCLGGAIYHVPVLLDGVISNAAALAAVRLCPNAVKALLPSHCSAEPAGAMLLDELGLQAPLRAGICLGEGTGAVAVMPMLDMALAVYHGMSTFQGMKIKPYQHFT